MNNIETYSTYDERKEIYQNIKNRIFKHMTVFSKNVYFDVLDHTFNKYNNTVHRAIKMKSIEVTDDYYAEHNEDPSNKKILNLKLVIMFLKMVKISKYKNIFAKGYTPDCSEEDFVINKIKNTVLQTYAISDLDGEEITGSFYEKELQKN